MKHVIDIPLCIDCEHVECLSESTGLYRCKIFELSKNADPVLGRTWVNRDCQYQRSENGSCGLNGKLFKQKVK